MQVHACMFVIACACGYVHTCCRVGCRAVLHCVRACMCMQATIELGGTHSYVEDCFFILSKCLQRALGTLTVMTIVSIVGKVGNPALEEGIVTI